MNDDLSQARADAVASRAQVSSTLAAIDHRVRETKATAARAVNPLEWARANPWAAIAAAAGAGVAIAASGSDRRAVKAAIAAGAAAPGAAADAASHAASHAAGATTGMMGRLVRGVVGAVDARLADVAQELIRSASGPRRTR